MLDTLAKSLNQHPDLPDRKRRELLLLGLAGVVCAGVPLAGCGGAGGGGSSGGSASPGRGGGSGGVGADPSTGRPAGAPRSLGDIGPLNPPDANRVALPDGFSSRIVARTGEMVANTGYTWHIDPDGGACFATDSGGWVYVSNSEHRPGGVGAIRFDADGQIVNAYRIADNQRNNCAGGATPWGTWMTCEEDEGGQVFETDPMGLAAPVAMPALGRFKHEAVAIDPVHQHAYLTEDRGDGGFYRSIPEAYPDFRIGRLQIAEIVEHRLPGPSPVRWNTVPDPAGGTLDSIPLVLETNPTRRQAGYTAFDGGEGIWFFEGIVYFATKGDSVIWAYNTEADTVEKIYDLQSLAGLSDGCGPLCEPDNVTVSGAGDVIVAEDDGLLRLVIITPERKVLPLLQIQHPGSELTGPAFSPNSKRLYFSSQKGTDGNGVTFEITGPFTT